MCTQTESTVSTVTLSPSSFRKSSPHIFLLLAVMAVMEFGPDLREEKMKGGRRKGRLGKGGGHPNLQRYRRNQRRNPTVFGVIVSILDCFFPEPKELVNAPIKRAEG